MIGPVLRRVRERAGVTQRELASVLGVRFGESTTGRMEAGSRRTSPEEVRAWLDYCEATREDREDAVAAMAGFATWNDAVAWCGGGE